MNPRLFCRERSFHKALLLTYSFDPVFFEQIVLADLWAWIYAWVVGKSFSTASRLPFCISMNAAPMLS